MIDKIPYSPDDSDFTDQWPLEFSEYLKFDDDQWPEDDPEVFVAEHVTNQDNELVADFEESGSRIEGPTSSSECEKKYIKDKVAFRIKSEVEILDDGFKWRKYGNEMVKNIPNPRNDYRCSKDGCQVKKRVERNVDDLSYMITTYEGTHTHPSFH